MPTTWFYIKGCPFEDECSAQKTSPLTKKVLTWSGKTEQEAVDKCAHHLMNSTLHKKPKRVAYDAAWNATMSSYEDDTDEEEGQEAFAAEAAPGTPPRPTKRARMAIADGDHADNRSDPLVAELATRVERLVEQRERGGRASSSGVVVQTHYSVNHGQTVREAKENIADAEEACRKAQGFALSAAKAFGDGAAKLNRTWQKLED